MRGSHIATNTTSSFIGIIPAHAGLTYHINSGQNLQRDHPRACGAHRDDDDIKKHSMGSSPRMRGSPAICLPTSNSFGIIPAHAGSRGEPLADENVDGIIPAHAGLTQWNCRDSESERDHPRACGAHQSSLSKILDALGSSPRMRGSPRWMHDSDGAKGIIPAHAGLTHGLQHADEARRDHPRACGAHQIDCLQPSASSGSSPRMRGSRLFSTKRSKPLGIIPAHAGLTYRPCRS